MINWYNIQMLSSKNWSRNDKIKFGLFIWLGLFVVVFYSVSWWSQVYNSPTKVFADMIESSLTTSSVTKRVRQVNDDQSIERVSYIAFGDQNISHTFETRSRSNDAYKSSIEEEIIGTPTRDYVRFNKIASDAKLKDGTKPDYSNIIGVWGSTSANSADSTSANSFGVAAFGTVPIAPLGHSNRKLVTDLIKLTNVYDVDTDHVVKSRPNGRVLYTYHVKIDPRAYFAMIQKLSLLAGVTNNTVATDQPQASIISADFTVDVIARQLVKIHFESSNIDELYGSYGVSSKVEIPSITIPLSELQTRIQKI